MGSPKSKAVAVTIAALAQSFALETVAEGVETQHQLAQLSELGIDVIQGYYFSKPVDSEHVLSTIFMINDQASATQKAA